MAHEIQPLAPYDIADTTPQNLLGKLHERIVGRTAEGGKPYNGDSRNDSDDIAVGMMIVPA